MNGTLKMENNNTHDLIKQLSQKADWVWRETLKIHKRSPETRVASSLSPIEIFVVLYYGGFLNQNPKDPKWEGRDRCIISKGHGSLCMYPILADLGFFPFSELEHICEQGSFLGGIPDPIIPGYETVNGSLGHGLGVASGVALALKRRNRSEKVFVLVGDGELHEGSNWEAIMFACQHGLDNLTLLIDNNQISMLGPTDEIVSHRNLIEKFRAFGWATFSVENGHSVEQVYRALSDASNLNVSKPKVIEFNTKKGNKVPGLENAALSHVTAINSALIDQLLGGGE